MSNRAQVLRRAAAGTLAAAAVAPTGFVAAAPANAVAPPNLRLTGVVFCDRTFFVPKLVRQMTATNTGGITMRNVTLQEINGQSRFSPNLAPGATLQIRTEQPGCFASSISGYVISDNREDLLDNYGFYYTFGTP